MQSIEFVLFPMICVTPQGDDRLFQRHTIILFDIDYLRNVRNIET